jgi:hypothetical protein
MSPPARALPPPRTHRRLGRLGRLVQPLRVLELRTGQLVSHSRRVIGSAWVQTPRHCDLITCLVTTA